MKPSVSPAFVLYNRNAQSVFRLLLVLAEFGTQQCGFGAKYNLFCIMVRDRKIESIFALHHQLDQIERVEFVRRLSDPGREVFPELGRHPVVLEEPMIGLGLHEPEQAAAMGAGRIAAEALATSNTEFRKQAGEQFKALADQSSQQLDTKKELIDARLKEMGATLKGLNEKSTQLTEGLKHSSTEMEKLRSTADNLREVLSSSQKRGQWGERMVEDILRVLGLVEGLNYTTQTTDATGTRPDFTFMLPKSKTVNLDVKFPIDQYERYVEAEGETEAQEAKKEFLQAVKGHLKDVAGRGYVDPAAGTVDYVMVFIPNESIYAFIHQSDPEILEYALSRNIVLCSPITLYAVLSLIRQSVESFHLEEQASEIMTVLG
ncbi:MAG: DNA recombination protein RmuC, partial [Planctomycetes bacterium]|nr:DNA recombination protein RmuC [Planctomycetota bacterium]